jgi:hypothetical protein
MASSEGDKGDLFPSLAKVVEMGGEDLLVKPVARAMLRGRGAHSSTCHFKLRPYVTERNHPQKLRTLS